MHSTRILLALIAAFSFPLGSAVLGQDYPNRPITIVVPIAAGTGMDLTARLYGERLSQRLGKPVVIDNRAGAGLSLAPATVAKAPADGHTLLVAVTGMFATFPTLYKRLNYDPSDFVPIAIYLKSPFVLVVNPKLPIHSMSQLIAAARERRLPLTYSTPGAGTMQHLAAEEMKRLFKFEMTQVPYRNTGQSLVDVAAGHVDAGVAEAGASVPLIREGKLRALAVTSAVRFPVLPDVPTLSEATDAKDFEAVAWHALVAPAATSSGVVTRLHDEMKQIMADPSITKEITQLGLVPFDTPPLADMKDFLEYDRKKWSSVVRQLGLEGTQ